MNNINKHQCKDCRKNFPEREIYFFGKEKEPVCESCKKNIKTCSWCQKNVSFSEYGNYPCFSNGTKTWNNDGTEEKKYNVFCDEKCRDELQTFEKNTPEKIAEQQKRQELLDKGYKTCGWNLIPFEPLKIDCNNLILSGEKYCENCQKREKEREENLKKRRLENQQAWAENDKKVEQAQNWWNSLSHEEKKAEVKKIEEEWIKKAGGDNFSGYVSQSNFTAESGIKFENGSLHVYPEDLSKIPPPLLEKFGVDIYPSQWKNYFPCSSHSTNLPEKISNLESKQGNCNSENSPNSEPNKVKYWIMGISLVSILVLGIVIRLTRKKRQ